MSRDKQLNVRLDDTTYDRLIASANNDERTPATMAMVLIKRGLDDWEGAESITVGESLPDLTNALGVKYDRPVGPKFGPPIMVDAVSKKELHVPDIHRVPSGDDKPWEGPITKSMSMGKK